MELEEHKKLLSMMEDVNKLFRKSKNNVESIKKWLNHGALNIKSLKKSLQDPKLPHGTKVGLESVLEAHVSLNLRLLKIISVGNLKRTSNESDNVKWQDVSLVFQCRMQTGVIVNLHHLDLRKL